MNAFLDLIWIENLFCPKQFERSKIILDSYKGQGIYMGSYYSKIFENEWMIFSWIFNHRTIRYLSALFNDLQYLILELWIVDAVICTLLCIFFSILWAHSLIITLVLIQIILNFAFAATNKAMLFWFWGKAMTK